jgi:CheY-like chemotaxis protein
VDLADIYLDDDFTARYPGIKPGPFLRLMVRDTGSGIALDIVDRIFDPFFTTKEKGQGTGLGLSVVHGIVKSLDGAITVYSEPEKGTEFDVYLPVVEREIKEEQDFEVPLPTGTEHILFVDDERPIREMSKKLIESLGYRVEVRSNGTEALELFKADPEKFDLIITDMTMPGMTGDQLAEQLMSVRSDIPIILCTGFSARIDEKKSKAMGIQAFALKPMIKSDIAKIIRTVLDDAEKK